MVRCPHCGASVKKEACFCPECGSDASTGWARDTGADSLELPERGFEDDDYQAFLEREGLRAPPAKNRWKRALLVAVVLLTVAGMLLFILGRH